MGRLRMGPIETLADAVGARRLLWVLCKACGRARRFDPRNLIALKGELALRDLQEKLRCRRCGKREAAVVVSDGGWPRRD